MTADEIRQYLTEMNAELERMNFKGEVCIYGGAVMCLAFNARPATKDVDAVFEPVKYIRRAAGLIAERHGLEKDWLNFAVRMFVVPHEKRILIDLPNLKVFVPETDYLLAMKVLAARADTPDSDDIVFLIDRLKIRNVDDVFGIVQNYYPNKVVKPETRFLIEEIVERLK